MPNPQNPYNDPFRDAQAQVTELRNWARGRRRGLGLLVAGLLVALGALTSYYQIEPDELGVVLRFGKHTSIAEPGPHFKLPFGIEQVIKVPQRTLKMEFGFRTVRADTKSQFARPQDAAAEAEMVTGDLNVGIVEWIVQYRITSPEKYLFRFRDIDATLRLMSEAAVRAVVGDHSIDELLTSGRDDIETDAKALLADLNLRYDTGITIDQLKLQEANVPDLVRPALTDVEEAKQERERAINEAWAEYNQIIPKARGSAQQALESAEGYAVERVNHATGDAERFRALHAEYKKAPDVTRTRLYLEALGEILPRARRKIIVDADTKGLVPLLNLTEEKKQ